MDDAKKDIERLLETKLAKELAKPERWREAMIAAWAKHPDPRIRDFAGQWEHGTSVRDLAMSHRDLIRDALQVVARLAKRPPG